MYQFDYEKIGQGILIFMGLFLDEIFSIVENIKKKIDIK